MNPRKTTEPDSPKEAVIRDHLAENLHVIEVGLKLRDTNVEVQNPDGAAGFIDIFAEDRWGHKVVIELKRSNQAARQALNEIFKYAGLLQRHYGLRPSDFRVMVVSTTWHELLVPFSECLKDLAFPADGFQIWVDNSGKVVRATKIEPLPKAHLLDFIPHHLIYTFDNRDARDAYKAELQEKLLKFGASDFVFFCLDYNGPRELPFPYAVYACLGTLPESAIKSILANAGVLEGVEDCRAWSEGDDFAFWQRQFEQHAFGSFAIEHACGEVSSPEHAESVRREWTLGAVVRHGRWKGTESVYDDAELWRCVARADRGNLYFFKKKTSPRFKAEWNSLPENARGALLGYGPWQSFFGPYLQDIAVSFPKADVEIAIYNPCDLLSRIYREPFSYFEHRSLGALDQTFTQLLSAHGFSMPVLEAQWTNAPEPRVSQITFSDRLIRIPWPDPRPPGESFLSFFYENRAYAGSLVKFFDEYSVGL